MLRKILSAAVVFLISPSANPALANPSQLVAVPSIAAMTQLGDNYSYVHVAGYHFGSRRGGGNFIWDASARISPDNCTVFSGSNPNGRWMRELTATPLDVTMCGAKWDGISDDAAAISAAFTAASRAGISLSCPGGTGRIANTVAPASFAGVVFRCQGMRASTIRCAVPNKPCFLFQNANGTDEVQAPQIYDLGIVGGSATANPSAIIQYNSAGGGFLDAPTTQSYMMRPIVQRVRIEGGEIGVQCSKCFDGDISLNLFTGQSQHGINLEGSDWMGVGAAGTNRIVSSGNFPIKIASHGTFGNGSLVTHNDILSPAPGVGAYIYTSGRTTYIEKNFFEGSTRGACEIKIDGGAMHATVRDNHVTDATVTNWLCVVPRLAQAEFTGNQTTSYGQGPARFDGGSGPYNSIYPQTIVHFGNWSEAGFPPR